MKKYYDVLDVDNSYTLDNIKKSYYDLVKQYHTDVNSDPAALEKIKKINEAWDWIKKNHKIEISEYETTPTSTRQNVVSDIDMSIVFPNDFIFGDKEFDFKDFLKFKKK